MPNLAGNKHLSVHFFPHGPRLFHLSTEKSTVRSVGNGHQSGYSRADTINKNINKLENGTRRAQIPRKPLIFPSPNKQTNRQTKNFGHTEVRTLDRRIFSTRLLPTELLSRTSVITLIRLLLSDYYYPGID